MACDIIEKKLPFIILLGGTSGKIILFIFKGSGKSTLSSIMTSKFGISTALSTDSIRHIMRNFIS